MKIIVLLVVYITYPKTISVKGTHSGQLSYDEVQIFSINR
jgi:hypothetical protein